ncbi:hypothetical protein WAI453_005377 [Rhynchosporium graminicola]
MKPHQRKNTRGHPGSSSSEIAEERDLPVFFFLPNDHPNSLFCQWHSSSFTVPRETLEWLRTAHPAHAESHAESSPPPKPINTDAAPTDIKFNCAEQFLMFCKALYFHDKVSANLIMATNDPSLQKKYGRAVADFTDFLWRQSSASMDRRWGIGYKENHALKYRGNWGENLLGKAIMQVRKKIWDRLKEMEKLKEEDIEMYERVADHWDCRAARCGL